MIRGMTVLHARTSANRRRMIEAVLSTRCAAVDEARQRRRTSKVALERSGRQLPDALTLGDRDEFVRRAGPEAEVVLGRHPRRGGIELERVVVAGRLGQRPDEERHPADDLDGGDGSAWTTSKVPACSRSGRPWPGPGSPRPPRRARSGRRRSAPVQPGWGSPGTGRRRDLEDETAVLDALRPRLALGGPEAPRLPLDRPAGNLGSRGGDGAWRPTG